MDFHGINASVRTGIYSMVPLTPAFPCERGNQRKQQRSSCLRRPQSMGREGGEKIQLYKHGGNVLKSEPRAKKKTEVTRC